MYSRNKSINYICEYIWIGGNGEIRSKTKVIPKFDRAAGLPDWNFDGSSTDQAPSDGNTEVILSPIGVYNDPLRSIYDRDNKCILVLCDTYDNNNKPLPTNHRHSSLKIFNEILDEKCWFGLEQEYFIRFHNTDFICENTGEHYCGISKNYIERKIVEEHLRCCIEAGLNISGINAEVASGQWEFQIGPSDSVSAADELIIARYLLQRIAEKHGATIDYSPKISDSANGSGCHINFSTEKMRNEDGFKEILHCMNKLELKHAEHIAVYGANNHKRLTGLHETSSMDKFTWGIGTRNTSVRIPNVTRNNGCGYFEDRRPAANIDPYLATSIIAKTCCLDFL
jgi:glutamine synthetase